METVCKTANTYMSKRILLLLERGREHIDEALQHFKQVIESGCGCTFGVCTRNEKEKGEGDWYEPCEPQLECEGLPWFYFCDPQKLKSTDRLKYEKYFQNCTESNSEIL